MSKTRKKESKPRKKALRLPPQVFPAFIILFVLFFFREILLKKHFLWEDMIEYLYPLRFYLVKALHSGHLPFWSPYIFSGMPFLSEPQAAVFYPFNLLLVPLSPGGHLSFYLLELQMILHFLIAAFSMYYLMRKWGASHLASTASAITYAFSSFLVLHIIHGIIVNTFAWFPLLLLIFDRALEKSSLFYSILTGLFLGFIALAGYPQLMVYLALFMGLYLLYFLAVRGTFRDRLKLVLLFALMMLIFGGLWLWQVIPTNFMNAFTERKVLDFEASAENSIKPLVLLIKLLVPKYYGSMNGIRGQSTYFGGNYWSYWEAGIYVGIMPLLLSLYYLFRRKKGKAWLFGALGLFSLWFSMGKYGGLYYILYHLLPPLQKFRNPPRFSAFFVLTFSVLTGFAIDYIRKADRQILKGFLRILGALLLFALALEIYLRMGGTPSDYREILYHGVRLKAVNVFLLVSLLSFLLFFAFYKTGNELYFSLIPLLIAFDLYIFGHDFPLGERDPTMYYDRNKLPAYVRNDGDVYRLNIRKDGYLYLPRNAGPIVGYEIIDGYEVLKLDRYIKFYMNALPALKFDLLNVKYRLNVDLARKAMEIVKNESYLPRAFLVREARSVDFEEALRGIKEGDFDYRSVALVESLGTERKTYSDSGTVEVLEKWDQGSVFSVSVPDSAFLVISEVWYPEWKVLLDGKETRFYPVDLTLLGVEVPPGKHRVELKFVPKSFYKGLKFTLLTLVVSVLLLLVSLKRERKRGS
ncbi:MAG: YfhO family protein [Candidatus Hydrothermae bacterium]|nr:YfhO family protein [Candidatus Hydrothermae bacterium]